MKFKADIWSCKEVEFKIPPQHEAFVKAWLKNDEDRTEEEEDMVQEISMLSVVEDILGEHIEDFEINSIIY